MFNQPLIYTPHIDCFPVMVALNRTDNLLAHTRFAHRREEDTPLTRLDSYAGLDTQQKNLKKAKKFGLKMMPSLKLTNGSPLKSKSNDNIAQTLSDFEIDEMIPASPTEEANTQDKQKLFQIQPDSETVLRSPSHLPPVPRPRSRLPSNYGLGTEVNHRSPSPCPPPVPQPRGRVRSNGSSDTGSTGEAMNNSPIPTPRRRTKSNEPLSPNQTTATADQTLLFEQNEVPHYQLPVGVSSGNNLSTTGSFTSLEGEKPVPKPRKSPTASPRHEKMNVRAEIRVPMLTRGSDEVSLDFFPPTTSSDRRGSHDSTGESVLDFIPNERSPRPGEWV